MEYPDNWISYDEPLLWNYYDVNTTKFEIGVYDQTGDAAATTAVNAKGYGMLSSVWLGFKDRNARIYVLDLDEEEVTYERPVKVNNGQQSADYYLATAPELAEAQQ